MNGHLQAMYWESVRALLIDKFALSKEEATRRIAKFLEQLRQHAGNSDFVYHWSELDIAQAIANANLQNPRTPESVDASAKEWTKEFPELARYLAPVPAAQAESIDS